MNRGVAWRGIAMLAAYALVAWNSWNFMRLQHSFALTFALLVFVTGMALGALWSVCGDAATNGDTVRFVWRIALMAAAIATLSVPSNDLSYYVAQARFVAHGGDGYRTLLSEEAKAGLHVSLASARRTSPYGPLWAYGAALLSRISAPFGVRAEYGAFKLVVLASWIAIMAMVRRLMAACDNRMQAIGLVIIGWFPASVYSTVSEAHNDVVMVAFLTWWLAMRRQHRVYSPIALVLSVLVKYVTAPLLALAAVDAWRNRRYRELALLMMACAGAAAVVGAFWHVGDLTSGFSDNTRFRFLSVVFVLGWTLTHLGLSSLIAPAIWLFRAVLVGGVIWYGWRWGLKPDDESRFVALVAACLIGILLGSNYEWPWYLPWLLPPLVLSGDVVLRRIMLPVIVCLPFGHLLWMGWSRVWPYQPAASLTMFSVIVTAWAISLWSTWRMRNLQWPLVPRPS